MGGRVARIRLRSAIAAASITLIITVVAVNVPAEGASVFADDLESGTLGAWTSTQSASIEATIVHQGSFAARVVGSGGPGFLSKALPSAEPDLHALLWFRIVDRQSSLGLVRFRSGSTTLLNVSVTAAGRLATRNGLTKVQQLSPAVVDPGVWHELQVHARIDGVSGQQDVWLDGGKVSSLSRIENLGAAPIDRVDLGETATGRTFNMVIDDIRTATTLIDTHPPTKPQNLTATAASPTSIDLAWDPSVDDFGVASYTVWRDDGTGPQEAGRTASTTFTDAGLAPGIGYTYVVASTDLVGNASQPSDPVTVSTSSSTDGEAPSAPIDLQAQAIAFDAIEISWTASTDDVGVTEYAVSRDDGTGPIEAGRTPDDGYVDRNLQPGTTYTYVVEALDRAGNRSLPSSAVIATTPQRTSSPIEHIVILYQENQSFDHVLGAFCTELASGEITGHMPCDGASTGRLSNGTTIPLGSATDLVPEVAHSVEGQKTAIAEGAMDGFNLMNGCTQKSAYRCYTRYAPSQIPNLAALANEYVIADRTFEFATTPSWAGHMVLATADLDGFRGSQPDVSTSTTRTGPGLGCDSFRDADWWNGAAFIAVPSCIPDQEGRGPYPRLPGSVRADHLRSPRSGRHPVEDLRGRHHGDQVGRRLWLGNLSHVLLLPSAPVSAHTS